MKTCRQLSLFLALSTLPLSAQEAKTPAPAAPQAAETQAHAEALAAAKGMLAIIDEMNAIAATDKPIAEKTAAVRALKPRAQEQAKLLRRIGMRQVQSAAQTLMEPQETLTRFDALDKACEDEDFRAASDEIGAILTGLPTPDSDTAEQIAEPALIQTRPSQRVLPKPDTEAPAPQRTATTAGMAEEFLAVLRACGKKMMDDSLNETQKMQELQHLQNRLQCCILWVLRAEKSAEMRALLEPDERLTAALRGLKPLHGIRGGKGASDFEEAVWRFRCTVDTALENFAPKRRESLFDPPQGELFPD